MKTTYFWLAAACCGAMVMGCSGGDDAEGGPSGAAGAGGVLADAPHDSPPKETSTPSDAKQEQKTDASAAAGLGSKCASDADCGSSELKCLLPDGTDLAGGGPAHGYCSKKCDDLLNGDVVDDPCAPLDGVCHDFGAYPAVNGWCLQTCTFGGGGTAFSAKKCRARKDVGCTQISEGEACLPMCGKDADCPSGLLCDPRTSVCVAPGSVSTGDPLGATCKPGANQNCAGQCFQFTKEDAGPGDVGRMCSQLCVYGTADTCNFDNGAGLDAGAAPVGFCMFGTSGVSTGDRGICGQLCDVASDCTNQVDNIECAQDTVTNLGHGYCHMLPGKQSDAGAGDAQADSASGDAENDGASGDAQDDSASGDAESDVVSGDAQVDSADDVEPDSADEAATDASDDVEPDASEPADAAAD